MAADPNVSFHLHNIPFGPEYRNVDYSSTSVPWFSSKLFADKVEFQAWDEFEDLARNVQVRLNNLEEATRNEIGQAVTAHDNLVITVKPSSEAGLRDLFLPLYKCWQMALNKLNFSQPEASLNTGWSCGTHAFHSFFGVELNAPFEPLEQEENNTADFMLMKGDSPDEFMDKHCFPIAALALKGPCRPSSLYEEESDSLSTWRFISNFLKPVFDDRSPDWCGIGKIIAQALIQALLSYSGCAVLYCHTWARALRFYSVTRDRIVVKISRVFTCDEELSASLAALTTFDLALRIVDDGLNENPRNIERLKTHYLAVRMIAGRTNSGRAQRIQRLSARDVSRGRQGFSVRRDARDENHASEHLNRGNEGPSLAKHRSNVRKNSMRHQDDESSRWTKLLEEDVLGERIPLLYCNGNPDKLSTYLWLGILCGIWRWDRSKAVNVALRTGVQVIGKGGAGLVRKGVVDNLVVAVKCWNREDSEYLRLMRNEAAMYCFLATYHSGLMGKVLPRLIAVGDHAWYGMVLVTEMVGEHLKFSRDGSFQVGNTIIQAEDRCEILQRARENLRTLHDIGVCHGDTAMSNLRVIRLHEDAYVPTRNWKVWWIDLGSSYFTTDSAHFAEELRRFDAEMEH